jgi:hypothetical protein
LLKLFEMGTRAMSNLIERSDATLSPYSAASEITEAAETVAEIAVIWSIDPTKLAEAQGALIRSYIELWSNSAWRLFGAPGEPLVKPEPSDSRFKDLVGKSLLRLLQASLSADDAMGRGLACANRGSRRRHTPESGMVLPADL